MRAQMARRAAAKRRNSASVVLGSMRVWDEFDATSRLWASRGKKDAKARAEQFGNSAISLSKLQPVDNLWQIEWGEAINFKRSDGGMSSGVYFVVLPEDRARRTARRARDTRDAHTLHPQRRSDAAQRHARTHARALLSSCTRRRRADALTTRWGS